MDASMLLPGIEPADSNDTRSALQAAQTLWGQGERREALQWVRRAAEAAAETGQDDRALALAKAGAELRSHLEIPLTVPPPPPPPDAAIPVVISAPAPAPPADVAARSPDAGHSAAPSGTRPSQSPRSDAPPSSPSDPELVVTVVAQDGSGPAPDVSLVSHRAVRVAVFRESKERDLAVRVLSPGEVAPKNATVALLVGLAPGASPVPGED